MTDQAAEFAALFPEHNWVYGPAMDMSVADSRGRRRQFGNMLLARATILSSRNHLLPKMKLAVKMSLQRAALEAVIEAPSGPLRVYSAHLNHSDAEERLRQIARIREILAGAPAEGGAWTGRDYHPVWEEDGPQPPMPARAILLGDFNLRPDSEDHAALLAGAGGLDRRLARAWPRRRLGLDLPRGGRRLAHRLRLRHPGDEGSLAQHVGRPSRPRLRPPADPGGDRALAGLAPLRRFILARLTGGLGLGVCALGVAD